MGAIPLERGLEMLGQLLREEHQQADLVLVGAGALLLQGHSLRPTADLDVVARVQNGALQSAQPFSHSLTRAVRRVGAALDLPHVPKNDKDWLNPGPSFLTTFGLPEGFEDRLATKIYGALTIRIAARADIIALKFLAATDPQRERRAIDRSDLRQLSPTRDEILHALRWCRRIDGRTDFLRLDAAPLLAELGMDPAPLFAELDGRAAR